jgi:carboxymethylenebutenolidase
MDVKARFPQGLLSRARTICTSKLFGRVLASYVLKRGIVEHGNFGPEKVTVMCWRELNRPGLLRVALIILSAIAGVSLSGAPASSEEPTPRPPEWVEIKTTGDRVVRAMVAHPPVDAPARVVVILHEDRGLTTWERRLADQLSQVDAIVIAPDLLSDVAAKGSGTDSFETIAAARAALYDLKSEVVALQLDAVCNYAHNLPGENKRVTVVGFGWGGAQAFLYAAHNPDIAATAVFYGAAPTAEPMRQIKSPVFGFYAENDTRITGEVTRVRGQMVDAGRDFRDVTYAGAAHGFFRTGEAKDASPADRKARSEAWERLMEIVRGP